MSVPAVAPTGREHSTAIGVWDVWVVAFAPRSNCCCQNIKALLKFGIRTRVRRDVFPAPLGPSSRIEGRVVRPLARKTTVWRKMGMVRTRRMPTMRAIGEGLKTA